MKKGLMAAHGALGKLFIPLCSVGAHVRDAAAYACWAFARAYTSADMAEAARELAPALISAACYDREVCILSVVHWEHAVHAAWVSQSYCDSDTSSQAVGCMGLPTA